MALGILSYQNKAITTPNLLNKEFLFPISPSFTWNTVSGGSNGQADNTTEKYMYGNSCLKVTFLDTGEFEFNRTGTSMDTTIEVDGNYILQYWLYKSNPSSIVDFTVKVFVNGINIADTTFTQTLDATSGFVEGNWNCYYNQIMIPLLETDVVTFQYVAQSDSFGSGEKLFIDGMKLELNDINQNTEPSIYTAPLDIVIESTETIDIGSIGSNSSVVVVASVIGARVGDFVQMTYPVALITADLIVGYPIATDDDEISFVVHNKSGGSVNPASGDFTFKIVR
jgi:hypothetical protein